MHLSELFRRSVAMYGDRPALAVGTNEPVTYARLERRVHALARWFADDLRLARGDRVTIAMQNCPQYLEALLAAWHAGLCAVPVNAKLHPKEVRHIIGDSGSALCISRGEQAAALRAELAPVRVLDVDEPEWDARDAPSAVPAASADSDDLAWLFYTSGTTGRPKGVMLTHANLIAMALGVFADVQSVDANDVLFHAAPMSHGSGMYVVPYVLAGALQVVPPSGGFDEAEVFATLRHYRSVSFFAAPTIVTRLVQYAGAPASFLLFLAVMRYPFLPERFISLYP